MGFSAFPKEIAFVQVQQLLSCPWIHLSLSVDLPLPPHSPPSFSSVSVVLAVPGPLSELGELKMVLNL